MIACLSAPTLVLNKSWIPVDSTTARNAICNVISDRALCVDHHNYSKHNIFSWMQQPVNENDLFIRTLHGKMRVPKIILLNDYNKMVKKRVVFCRLNLWKRDHYRCQYCAVKIKPNEASIDHIIPRSRGGTSCFENCVLSCLKCNVRKRNRTPEEANMRLRTTIPDVHGKEKTVYYDRPKHPVWHPYYAVRGTEFPDSWSAFMRKFDHMLYWQVALER